MTYDVWIMKRKGNIAYRLAGLDMKTSGSFHTVAKRLDTVSERLNEDYDAVAVEHGKYKQGDTIKKEDIKNEEIE